MPALFTAQHDYADNTHFPANDSLAI